MLLLINATVASKNWHAGTKKFSPSTIHPLPERMDSPNSKDANQITEQLIAWNNGDPLALDELVPVVYRELRRMADRFLRHENSGHTLQPTALVHEAWLRLTDQTRVNWQNRAQFFGLAAQMMRRILVDHAKTKHREKRGGDAVKLSLDDVIHLSLERATDLVALDEALEALSKFDQRKCRIVELRYFGGLSVEETAHILNVSPDTVMRDWKLAKAWLYQQLQK